MNSITWRSICLFLASLPVASVSAADESPFLADDLPVVLSASRLAQSRVDAPGAVTVLDREQIRASGLRDVAELLRLVPGFISSIVDGSYPVAAYHGLTRDRSNQMLVLVDGRSVYSPYALGGIEWNQLGVAVDDIERIEVFRGTNTVTYGANALLGVVSIITRNAVGSPRFTATTQHGEDGVHDVSLAGTLHVGEVGIRLRASQQQDSGFAGFHDGRDIKFVDMRADYQWNPATAFEAHLGLTDARTRRGYPTDSRDPPRWQENLLGFGLLRMRRALGAGDELMVSLYHQQEESRDRFYTPAPIPPILQMLFGWPAIIQVESDFGYRSTRDDIELQHTLALGEGQRFVWGAGARQDSHESPLSFYQRGTIDTAHLRVFGNHEWRISPRWVSNLGLMVENTSLSGTNAAPRFALNFHPVPDQAIRFAWSRGYRSPTPFEEMSDMRFVYDNQVLRWRYRPSGNLDPVRITATELGYVWEWRKHGVLIDTRLYNERLDKLITEKTSALPPGSQLDTSTNQVYSFSNAGSAHIRGLEYQLSWRPLRSSWITLNQNFINITSSDPKLANSAPHIATVLSLAHRWDGGWSLAATHTRYGRFRWALDTIDTLKPYHRTDLRAGYEFRIGLARSNAWLVVQNIGQGNEEYRPRYELQRRVYAGLSVEF